jgi:K+-transporting ATPase ATPase A chain
LCAASTIDSCIMLNYCLSILKCRLFFNIIIDCDYEMFLILIIPLSFPVAYGKLVGRGRGISILIAMIIGLGLMLGIALATQSGPKGLETRFGSFGSVLFNAISIATNTGAANSALSGMSPNAVISLFLGMFVQLLS